MDNIIKETKYVKYDKDIVIIYIKQFSTEAEEYEFLEKSLRNQEDEKTKIIIVPNEVVEFVERL